MATARAINQDPDTQVRREDRLWCQMHCLVCFTKKGIYSGKVLTTVRCDVGSPVKMPMQAAAEALSHCKSYFIQEAESREAAHLTQKVDPQ